MQVTATVISIADGSSLAFFPKRLERSAAVENKSAHGEPVEPLERLELTAV